MYYTTASHGTDLATQQLHTRQSLMQNQPHGHPVHNDAKLKWTRQQHAASTTLFKQSINNCMLCSASEVGLSGETSKGRGMISHQHCYYGISNSRPYWSFLWKFGKCWKVTRAFIYISNNSLFHISLLLAGKQCLVDSILHHWHVDTHTKSSKPLWNWIICSASNSCVLLE